jgi:phosphomannomutase
MDVQIRECKSGKITISGRIMEALMIGVSGMRGTIGGTLTPAVVNGWPAALAVWLKRDAEAGQRQAFPRGFRARFAAERPVGPRCRRRGLVASGVEVIDLDVVTTPGVAMMVRHLKADAGVIATASHNPIQWNGLKFLNRRGIAPPRRRQRIKQLYDQDGRLRAWRSSSPRGKEHRNARAARQARAGLRGCAGDLHQALQGGARQRERRRLRVHGHAAEQAGLPAGPHERHAQRPVRPRARADREEPHDAGRRSEAAEGADVGFAQDPDADRLAIVDENGGTSARNIRWRWRRS